MSETTVTEPTSIAYVRYARKTSPKQYESAEASVSLPVDLADPERTLGDHAISVVQFGLEKAIELAESALGLDSRPGRAAMVGTPVVEQGGQRVDPVAAAFPDAVNVAPALTPGAASPNLGRVDLGTAAPAANLPKGSDGQWRANGGTSRTAPIFCPKCNGEMWDNSVDKRKDTAPDAKCKDKNCVNDKGFNTGVWMDK
jgi:hypothetical protein